MTRQSQRFSTAALPLLPPVSPMLAKLAAEIPNSAGWIFEPKWDGFRALVFRNDDEIFIQSRDGKDLGRYFPELFEPLKSQLPPRIVLEGEIVVVRPQGLDFGALQLRLHPAVTRIDMLAKEIPASFVVFDLLAEADDVRKASFAKRRKRLESIFRRAHPPLHLTPATDNLAKATDWFERFEGAGLDGVIAKRSAGIYEPGKRAMLKVKHQRDCDCVVAGFRWHKNGDMSVGSLLLGLYDSDGHLQHVGVCSNFTAERRRALVNDLSPYRTTLSKHPWGDDAGSDRHPGGSSRWSRGKELSWEPIQPKLVIEVGYDHMQGSRFRHTAQFRRWRPDKPAKDCTFHQLEVVPPQELQEIFPQGR